MKTIERNGATITFDADLALRWVLALESGDYDQGQGQLRNVKGIAFEYCCLGVVCDIYDPSGWDGGGEAWEIDGDGRSTALLPGQLQTMLALDMVGQRNDKQPHRMPDSHTTLTSANDQGVPFSRIAAALREYYQIQKPETCMECSCELEQSEMVDTELGRVCVLCAEQFRANGQIGDSE